jgi:hypothetical protein
VEPALWVHSLLTNFAHFQTPLTFFGPGKKTFDMHVENDTDSFFFSLQQDGPLIPFVLDFAAFGLMLSLRTGAGAPLFLIRKLQHA